MPLEAARPHPARAGGARTATPPSATPRSASRRLLLALTAGLAFVLAPAAAAQIGDAPESVLERLEDYAPVATEEGGFTVASGFTFRVHDEDGVTVAVSGEGEMHDANVRFLGALIGAASGYGPEIAGPVSDFFRSRASDLRGAGEVPIEVVEYLMYVDLTDADPAQVSVRFEPQVVSEELFGTPAHVLGPDDARYVVRQFTDLQCPFCATFAQEGLPLIENELLPRGDVRFELYHFPLKSIHPNAVVAAEANECVAEEARHVGGAEAGEAAFWTFHDALFERQQTWARLGDPIEEFVAIADEAGLPSEGLAMCLRSGRFTGQIEASYRNAVEDLRLTGTPTVFVGGLKVGNYRSLEEYERLMRLSDALASDPAASTTDAEAPTTEPAASTAEPDAPATDPDAPDAD